MEIKNLTFLKSSVLLFSAMALFSCKKEDATEPKSNLNATQLNDYVAKLPSVQQRTPFAERLQDKMSVEMFLYWMTLFSQLTAVDTMNKLKSTKTNFYLPKTMKFSTQAPY